jgi:hypothetical protein
LILYLLLFGAAFAAVILLHTLMDHTYSSIQDVTNIVLATQSGLQSLLVRCVVWCGVV